MKRALIHRASGVLITVAALLGAGHAEAQEHQWRVLIGAGTGSVSAETGQILGRTSILTVDAPPVALVFEGQYMLTDALGLGLSFTPVPVDFKGKYGIFDGRTVGDAWMTPLALTLRYEFQLRGDLQPYVSAGVAATAFPFDSVDDDLEAQGVDSLCTDIGFGWVAEAGLIYNWKPRNFVTLSWNRLDISTDIDLEDDAAEVLDTATMDGSMNRFTLSYGWRF